MIGYYIDGKNLSEADRRSIDLQLSKLHYIYNSILPLQEFTFYTEDWEDASEALNLPSGCRLVRLK